MKLSAKHQKILCNLLVALAAVLLLIFVVPKILSYFMPFVVAFILSLIANPIVRFFERKLKIKRKYSSILVVVLVIAAIVLLAYGIGSAVVAGVRSFMNYFPMAFASTGTDLSETAGSWQETLDKIPFLSGIDLDQIGESIGSFVNNLISSSNGSSSVSAITNFVGSLPDILVSVIMALLATYFFTADRDRMSDFLKRHLPESFRKGATSIYQQVIGVVIGYFKAQFKIMGVIYIIVMVGLYILHIKFAWLIAFGIAFLDMLPVFGTGTVLIPWAVVEAFLGNYGMAIGMLVIYVIALVVHQSIQPMMVGGTIGMDAFLTLFFMFIGYKVNSVVGMIIAIPVGMIVINLFKAGVFDNLIWCVKELASDFNAFRRIGPEVAETSSDTIATKHPADQVIFMNMCMLCDGDQVLALDKVDTNYSGTTFPGGHVEPGENFTEAVIREMKEETGLTIHAPVLRGIYHWYRNGFHQVGLLYRADSFEGELKSSEEGKVYWIAREDYEKKELARGMEQVLRMMDDDEFSECFMDVKEDGTISEHLL